MPTAYGAEFRQDVIDVARKGETPLAQIAKDFGLSVTTLSDGLPSPSVKIPGPARQQGMPPSPRWTIYASCRRTSKGSTTVSAKRNRKSPGTKPAPGSKGPPVENARSRSHPRSQSARRSVVEMRRQPGRA
jgi:hypothetical protein